jgi:diguanylate cyclase (GGDEF)-like protein
MLLALAAIAILRSPFGYGAAGVIAMTGVALVLCLRWTSLDRTGDAHLLLWSTATVASGTLMWQYDGLRDASLLTLPLILLGAGQNLRKSHFLALLAVLLALVLGLELTTAPAPVAQGSRLVDTVIILLTAAALAWMLAAEARSAQARHARQIEQAQRSEKNLVYLAQHDALTGLPNRALGSELLGQGIAGSERAGAHLALLFVDLDNFKDINDSLGHSAGDDFLKLVANRLRAAVRKSDIVCRQGGDEFLIGLVNVNDTKSISLIANNVLEQVTQPCKLRDTEIVASCSIGVAMHPKDGTSYEDLLRHADLAMYQAKEAGRNTFRFFDDDINASVSENLYLISTLRTAITQKEFELHYQPVLDLSTGALIGAEALIRWRNPKLGLVSPALFIPAAEKSGLIVDIGQWVVEEACRQMQYWREHGAPPLTIAVNLSPVQFRRGDVEGIIERTLKKTGLDPRFLELEVTESTLVQDTEKFIQSLQRIKALGIRISIDDFGTGYSNLSYLQRFAVDKLKIDQSFVKRLMTSPQDLAIVTAIIQMAKSLNLTTNAEGVEDAATRDQLATIGCDLAQGYYFAKPLPADQFEEFMKTNLGTHITVGAQLTA